MYHVVFAWISLLISPLYCTPKYTNVVNLLREFNSEMIPKSQLAYQAAWDFETNITRGSMLRLIRLTSNFTSCLERYRIARFQVHNENIPVDSKRQLKYLQSCLSGMPNSNNEKLEELFRSIMKIFAVSCIEITDTAYQKNNKTCYSYRDLDDMMGRSGNMSLVEHIWYRWRRKVGDLTRPLLAKYIELKRVESMKNGWENYSSLLSSEYEVANVSSLSDKIWRDLQPLYEELHAYVRQKLKTKFTDTRKAFIPEFLLGGLWTPDWLGIYNDVKPFKDEPDIDVSAELKRRYDVIGMFMLAETFFTSIGWQKLPPVFWIESLFTKPTDGRVMFCEPTVWNMGLKKNVRVKMCASVNQEDFFQVHHQLGHIYYHLLYGNQPFLFRDGANPAFHEAVSGMFALDSKSPKHLFEIGLIKKMPTSEKSEINHLMRVALEEVVAASYHYTVDRWMLGALDGVIAEKDFSRQWWYLRQALQGIAPSFPQDENYFDPGANLPVYNFHGHTKNIISQALKFTIYKAVSEKAGCIGLFSCSIRDSYKAGKLLRRALKLGRRKPWQQVLKNLTGSSDISGKPMREYFQKLYFWLKEQRAKDHYSLGWVHHETSSHICNQSGMMMVVFLAAINLTMMCWVGGAEVF